MLLASFSAPRHGHSQQPYYRGHADHDIDNDSDVDPGATTRRSAPERVMVDVDELLARVVTSPAAAGGSGHNWASEEVDRPSSGGSGKAPSGGGRSGAWQRA